MLAYKNNSFYKGFISGSLSIFSKASNSAIDYVRNYRELLEIEQAKRTVMYLSQINDNNFYNIKNNYIFMNPMIEKDFINNKLYDTSFNDNISYTSKYDEFNDAIKYTLAYQKSSNLLDELMSFFGCDGNITNEDDILFETLFADFKSSLLFLGQNELNNLLATVMEEHAKLFENDNIDNIDDLVSLENNEIDMEEIDISDTIVYDRLIDAINNVEFEKKKINTNNNKKKILE